MKKIIICVVFVLMLSYPSFASETVLEEQKEVYGLNRVAETVRIDRDTTLDDGLNALLKRATKEFRGILTQGISCVVVAIAISALCGIVSTMFMGEHPTVLAVLSVLAVMGSVSGSTVGMIGIGRNAIEEITSFSHVLMPSLVTAGIASGTPLGASTRYGITMLFSDALLTMMHKVFLPLVYSYFGAITASAALTNRSLEKISGFLKWIITGSLKLFLMVFVGYITASGLIASTTDMLGVKTAQFAISGAVPVVGGILADAGETVIAGALAIKNSIGIVGMLGVLSIILTPFLTLGANYCLFKIAAVLAEPMCDSRLGGLLDKIGGGLGMVLAMLGSGALLLFISIISGMYVIGMV